MLKIKFPKKEWGDNAEVVNHHNGKTYLNVKYRSGFMPNSFELDKETKDAWIVKQCTKADVDGVEQFCYGKSYQVGKGTKWYKFNDYQWRER